MNKFILVIAMALLLTSCASVGEMKETGNPPASWVNLYSASVQIVTKPKPVRQLWNYLMGFISAGTGGGIDLAIEEPPEQ